MGGDAVAAVAHCCPSLFFRWGGGSMPKRDPLRGHVPGIAQDVASSCIVSGWAEDSDERWQRQWQIFSVVEKNRFNKHW